MRNLILLLILFTSEISSGQIIDPAAYDKNASKYWKYRDRLVKNFMLGVGPEQGQSIPAAERRVGPTLTPLEALGYNKLMYGDATAYLSQYIATLAMEIRLLQLSNNDITNSCKELFYALYAFNRLDIEAEKYFGSPSGIQNGFFMRDDIDNLTTAQINAINDGLPANRHIYSVKSDYLAKEELNPWLDDPNLNAPLTLSNSKAYDNEMSKVENPRKLTH